MANLFCCEVLITVENTNNRGRSHHAASMMALLFLPLAKLFFIICFPQAFRYDQICSPGKTNNIFKKKSKKSS